jgi:hypothetical protein
MIRTGSDILVDELTESRVQGKSRISSIVLGEELWFESSDVQLQTRPEVYASALLIPTLHVGSRLVLKTPLDSLWRQNCGRLLAVLQEWWGYPQLPPDTPPNEHVTTAAGTRTALCFSGGIDSFYTLLRYPEKIDDLVTVFGFDTQLEDVRRNESIEKSIREVAAMLGKRPIFVRTNIREHALYQGISWEIAHGGAMAAIGHLLPPETGRLLISSSRPYDYTEPWGSHWKIDPLWSSNSLTIAQFGVEWKRYEKLRMIAAEPMVRRHLRVCWENRTPTGNCSACDKCLRTRLALAQCGELDKYEVFSGLATLAADLRAHPGTNTKMRLHNEILSQQRLDPLILRELAAFVERSQKLRSVRPSSQTNYWSRLWASIRQVTKKKKSVITSNSR